MDQKIETYIMKIVNRSNCDEEEKREIMDEMKDHLYLLKKEFMDKGFSEKEATEKTLASFGEEHLLAKGLQESMFPFYKVFKICTWVLFVLYFLVVSFKLLIERIIFMVRADIPFFNFDNYLDAIKFNVNIVPLKTIFQYIQGHENYNTNIIVENLLGNIFIFLPLGIFLPLLFKKYKKLSTVIISTFIISFTVEFIQVVFLIGAFDIDDINLNILGSVFGFYLFKLIKYVFAVSKEYVVRKITN